MQMKAMSARVAFGFVGESSANGADDKLADDHAESTPDEDGAPAEALNGPEGDGRRAHVDDGEDQGDEEGVLNGVRGIEGRWSSSRR